MAEPLCGPSNALQNFQKQTLVDRTLQQDRVTTRQAPAESFRSPPGPNAGILDAEFEAFQAGQPLEAGYPEPNQFYHGPPASSLPQAYHKPQLPDWASDFQKLHSNEARASPIPQSQFRHHAPLQRPGEWNQDFLHQQNPTSPFQSQQQQRPTGQNYSGWSYGYIGGLMPQHHNTLSSMAQQKQSERQTEDVYDEAAFERAFDAAREEMQQSEVSARVEKIQLDAGLHDTKAQESQERRDGIRIGSDRILDEAQKMGEEGKEADDAEELARTAGQLLENVKGDQSQKFKESNFLSLMRQLRDREVRVEGDKLVDSSQPLHPGGSGYPIHHAHPDSSLKDEAFEFGIATNEEYKVDALHPSPPTPKFPIAHRPKSSEPTASKSPKSIGKRPGEEHGNHALQDYKMQLMLLEQQRLRQSMARHQQDAIPSSQYAWDIQ